MNEGFLNDLRDNGFAIVDFGAAEEIRALQAEMLALMTDVSCLEDTHRGVQPERLNELRLRALQRLQEKTELKRRLVDRAAAWLEPCLGLDIAVQRDFSLVVSMPGDPTSRVPFHADTWNGHSAFEINLWLPLSRTRRTAGMFLLPLPRLRERAARGEPENGGLPFRDVQEAVAAMADDFHWLDMEPGQACFFWHHLPHGNVVNQEDFTRWALNLRFRNLFAPYGDKGLGDYFLPLRFSPLTELALKHGGLWK